MMIILREQAQKEQVDKLVQRLQNVPLTVRLIQHDGHVVLGLTGDTSKIDVEHLKTHTIVKDVKRIKEPFKRANRKFHPQDSVVKVQNARFGQGDFSIIGGPCTVENEEQLMLCAQQVKKAGADVLRGGAFKPRTSPYSFQGLGKEGIKLLVQAKKEVGLPIVTELMDISQLDLFDDVDIVQVGARNMQNYELLKELGKIKKPVLLKRGLSSTLDELLMSAEYILSGGNEEVILCERGIRTFETRTRCTLDVSAVPLLKSLSHLPVIVDPSHALGMSKMVLPMSLASVAAGADGLMIEVHPCPNEALCDGGQALLPSTFSELVEKVKKIKSVL